MSLVRLAAFGDEIAKDLDEQIDHLEAMSIKRIELRGVWGKNALDLDDAELAKIERICRERGITIPVIGSPIGKIGIVDDFGVHLDRFERAILLARRFDAMIRVFSFYMPKGEDPADHRAEVIDRMRELTARARAADVKLVHENESGIYGDSPERCRDLIDSIDSPYLRACFDPANFIVEGYRPWPGAWQVLSDVVTHFHVKDARLADGTICPAGDGDANYAELLGALKAKGYDGLLSLEPHLSAAGRMSGFSGPELFTEAVRALRTVMSEAGLEEAAD